MRLGVIDVGSNTVHLLVVDAHHGAQPLPATSHKMELRLSEHVTDDGHIDDAGAGDLVRFILECLDVAEDQASRT
jgi:exopolyphosphatase/guanosine-5'-triphosphate,3'-diphosphate pyrophosphatase